MNVVKSTKLKIKLIRDDISSPLFGGPAWIGRELTVNAATAKRFVSMGYAEFVDVDAADAEDDDAEGEDSDETTGENSDSEEENADGLWNLTIKKLQKLAKKEKTDLQGITHKGDMINAIRTARAAAE